LQYTPHVLIIDDEMVSREALNALLVNEGYHLRFADNGVSGLAMAEASPPDLVLLDVMMPEVDGFEVCRRLRASSILAEVPVVMVTALDDRESRIAGIEAGADDFISKPVNRSELRARVRTITRLNRYRRLVARDAQLQWLLEQSRDGYVMMREDRRLVFANAKARMLLGLQAGDEVDSVDFLESARRLYKLEPPAAWVAWAEGESGEAVFLVRPESGTAAAFWVAVTELHCAECGPLSRLVQLRDVSRERASAIETAKLSRLIPHKLNTPLNHVSVSLSLLEEFTKCGELPSDFTELLTIARTGADQLTESVGDIMRYMSLSAEQRSSGRLSMTDLERLLAEVSAELGISTPRREIAEDCLHSSVALDDPALSLVIHELLENAKKFHPLGQPTIQCVVDRPAKDRVRLRIADDGVHLSPEQLARVFVPFDQAEKFPTGETPGMGLGLPLVRNLLWQIGGEIHLENRHDRAGIVVEIEFPEEV
jgi:DNA-binding response OmpR family regulator/two-component sensor histidine kinase